MPNSNFFANYFSLIRGWYTLGNRVMNSFHQLAQIIVAIKSCSDLFYKMESTRSQLFHSWLLDIVGYVMLKANSTLRSSLVIFFFSRIQCELMQ